MQVGVLGSGSMGKGIAQVAATSGMMSSFTTTIQQLWEERKTIFKKS
ncbi:MAG: 3-hydroxyacyl-CoA dehydrogenase NAD-binding domain-containing protein [Saprospiraceae bacterium]